ncbi:isocitrate/isopropylmalate family dehydrogenase [Micromonospora sp. NPDC002389]|uniref:isocitrate/isopropylmalate family dehydrogenase n=1 Tax=Micromonospora sp. NPDC002389 TaxID=3154272 RepID=UPI0033315F53
MTSRRYSIAVIAGDGIGQEVVPAAITCLDAVAARHGCSFGWSDLPWGSEYYRQHGRMMPTDGIDQLRSHDAIFLGAVGDPQIPDTETLWGLLIPIRRHFDQYVNLQPVRSLSSVPTAVVDGDGIDLIIVRENVEGEYSTVGGRIYPGDEREAAVQQAVFTRTGVQRVARFAANLTDGLDRHPLRPVQPTDLRPVLHAQHLPMLPEGVKIQPEPRGQFSGGADTRQRLPRVARRTGHRPRPRPGNPPRRTRVSRPGPNSMSSLGGLSSISAIASSIRSARIRTSRRSRRAATSSLG